MRSSFFFLVASTFLIFSCNPRLDERVPRYDEKECPFCIKNPTICSYCTGSGKCSFCNGTGKRVTSTENYPETNIEQVEYEEECPFCEGTGTCRYCDGKGKCWACHGTAKIDSWNFFEKYQKEMNTKEASSSKPVVETPKEEIGVTNEK